RWFLNEIVLLHAHLLVVKKTILPKKPPKNIWGQAIGATKTLTDYSTATGQRKVAILRMYFAAFSHIFIAGFIFS
ncbi:hypothetical protein ACJX0J_035367, partial [Zea mays]